MICGGKRVFLKQMLNLNCAIWNIYAMRLAWKVGLIQDRAIRIKQEHTALALSHIWIRLDSIETHLGIFLHAHIISFELNTKKVFEQIFWALHRWFRLFNRTPLLPVQRRFFSLSPLFFLSNTREILKSKKNEWFAFNKMCMTLIWCSIYQYQYWTTF